MNVLVNFVMADNRLIGSATSHISDISAGAQHAFGGELTFPSGAPIARLEVVVKIGKGGPCHTHQAGSLRGARHAESVRAAMVRFSRG